MPNSAHITMEPNLALAIIKASNAPTLLLDSDLSVIAASASFYSAFRVDVATGPLDRLGSGEWGTPQISALMKATVSGHAKVEGYEVDLCRAGESDRRLVLHARKLDYQPDGSPLLLTISDITDARADGKLADDYRHEQEILIRELHHRIANSLQIVASVLLQSARNVQSDETRAHLHNAHHRVMSVAALQKQLAKTAAGQVELKSYLLALCDSIGASMIHDNHLLALEVCADDSSVTGEVSVSLGLIVTELLINALKHAFPAGHGGKITVAYSSCEGDWTLSIRDDGVGMAASGQSPPKSGLGTGLVQALARQLGARVVVTDGKPGTDVSIEHVAIAASDMQNVIPMLQAV